MKTKTATVEEIMASGITGKSGKVYLVESELSVARKVVFDKWLVEFESGFSPEKLIKVWDGVIDHLNKFRMAEGIHALVEARNNVNRIQKRSDLMIKMCCLFLNSSDEATSEFRETDIEQKKNDLDQYSHNTFFLLLTGTLPGLLGNLSGNSQSTSQQVTDQQH